jgi:hypothetical protein
MDLGRGVLRFARNGVPLGEAFGLVVGPLVAVVTLASEESRVTIQNRPTVLNMGEYTGELRYEPMWYGGCMARAGDAVCRQTMGQTTCQGSLEGSCAVHEQRMSLVAA